MQSTHLPSSWVEALFAKLAAMYGDAFVRKWQGIEKSELIAAWSEALGPYADDGEHRGQRIKWALSHLQSNSTFPPSLPEFVALVRQAPRPQPIALNAPTMSIDEVAPHIAEMAKKIAAPKQDHLGWARKPPASGYRQHWEKAICDLAASGDERFLPILESHVQSGVIRSERAMAIIEGAHAT